MARTSASLVQVRSPFALKRHFRRLKDPRRRHGQRHRLLDIVVIGICAVLCGAKSWQQMATWATHRQNWLRRFLSLPEGIPSHDTLERVFERLDPLDFQRCFLAWIAAACGALQVPHVAIDGKTLRHSGAEDVAPLHVVSAWATANQLILGEVAVAEKSNEITAIPRLLEALDLNGALVTIDAMGCQKEIAAKILERGGDYVLAVKENQPTLYEDIVRLDEAARERDYAGASSASTTEVRRGREEQRSCWVLTDLEELRDRAKWPELKSVIVLVRDRTAAGKNTCEKHYYISSRQVSARRFLQVIRSHWGIENGLHWQLHVNFGEDASRARSRHGAENFGVLRRIALSLLKQHPSPMSIPCKQLAAAADTDFLEEILSLPVTSGKL
jgi:predicted transposase YbfD/YdcC